MPRVSLSRSSSSSSGAGAGKQAGKGKTSSSWYSETPTQRLAFKATVAGGVAFIGYGLFRAWTDYLDPFAAKRDEELVAAIPLVKGNPVVFLDLAVNGEGAGRVFFQLRKVSNSPAPTRFMCASTALESRQESQCAFRAWHDAQT